MLPADLFDQLGGFIMIFELSDSELEVVSLLNGRENNNDKHYITLAIHTFFLDFFLENWPGMGGYYDVWTEFDVVAILVEWKNDKHNIISL